MSEAGCQRRGNRHAGALWPPSALRYRIFCTPTRRRPAPAASRRKPACIMDVPLDTKMSLEALWCARSVPGGDGPQRPKGFLCIMLLTIWVILSGWALGYLYDEPCRRENARNLTSSDLGKHQQVPESADHLQVICPLKDVYILGSLLFAVICLYVYEKRWDLLLKKNRSETALKA